MKEHITKKQVVDCLNDSEIALVDKQTGDELPKEMIELLLEFIILKTTAEKFKNLISFLFKNLADSLYFSANAKKVFHICILESSNPGM